MVESACDVNLFQQIIGNNSQESQEDNFLEKSSCSLNFIQSGLNSLFIYILVVIFIYRKYCVKPSRERDGKSKIVKVHNEVDKDHEESQPLTKKVTLISPKVQSEDEKDFKAIIASPVENAEDGFGEGKSDKDRESNCSQRMFCHHVSIWNLTLIFILACFTEWTEAIILFLAQRLAVENVDEGGSELNEEKISNRTSFSDKIINSSDATTVFIPDDSYNYYQLAFDYVRLLTPAITLAAAALILIFYHQAETCQKAKYLLVNICFFIITSVVCWAKLYVHYYATGLSILHVKVLVDIVTCLSSAALTGFLIRTLFVHRKSSLAGGLPHEVVNFDNIKYQHYYSSLLSRISFYWFTALLALGYKRPLEDEDLGDLPPEEKTEYQFERFNKILQVEKQNSLDGKISLWKCFFKTLWASMLVGGVFRLAADFSGFVAPLGIKTIVGFTSSNQTISELYSDTEHLEISELLSNGYVMAIVILLSALLQSTFSQCSTFLVNSEGIHIKIALQALIYKKSLTLSPTKSSQPDHPSKENGDEEEDEDGKSDDSSVQSSASPSFGSGSIANVMSEDTNNIMMFFWMAHFIWAIPLKLAILMVLLYFQLGYSALIGAGICIIIMIPLQFLIGKNMSANSKELMERCDERLRAISEILQGMKLLKLHGWELLFTQQVSAIRKKELKNLDRDLLYRSMMTFLTHISSVLVTVVTFGLYPLIEEDRLEPSKVFAGLALFNQLTVPLFIFPITVPVVIDALVSTRRVRDFLLLPEAASIPHEEDSNLDGNGGPRDAPSKPKDGSMASILAPKPTQNRDLQASSDSVFILENIVEDEEEDKDEPVVEAKPAAKGWGKFGGKKEPAAGKVEKVSGLPPPTENVVDKEKMEEKGNVETENLQKNEKVEDNGKVDEKKDEKEKVDDKVKVDEKQKVDETEKADEKEKVDDTPKVDEKEKLDDKPKVDEKVKADEKEHKEDTGKVEKKDDQAAKVEEKKPAPKKLGKGWGKFGPKEPVVEKDPEDEKEAEKEKEPSGPVPSVLSVKNCYFSWEESSGIYDENSEEYNLQAQRGLSDISIEIPKDRLTVIVGSIGSGKSSIVGGLLGEMRKVSGEITWAKGMSIAYASQKPWILNASVRENILFGKPYKPSRYDKVLEACSLKQDMESLPEKDETEIGEKGINLSGGQKQRIAIARAFYSTSTIVILDDPLSALDIEVAHHVLDTGIRKFLLRSRRTVILVTHHLPVLHHAHHIIAMEKGRIRIQGALADIETRDNPLYIEWKEMITKKEAELQEKLEAKTAKERWSLLKLVSKIGLQFRKPVEPTWKPEEERKPQLDLYKKRKGTFSHYKNLSHDIGLPSDDCYAYDEDMSPLMRRRVVSRASRESRTSASSSKHVELQRMNSLQPESSKGKSPMLRQQSLPADDEQIPSSSPLSQTRPRAATYDNQRAPEGFFKKLFNSISTIKPISSTGSSNPELGKMSTSQRLVSDTSGASESDLCDDEAMEEQGLTQQSHDEREYGTIPTDVYTSYIAACGKFLSGLYLFFSIGYEVVRVYTNFWLSAWSDNVSRSTEENYEDVMSYYFHIYVLLSLITVVVSVSCNIVGKQAGANSRETLHNRMMDRVVRCPVRFFDNTPIGRIINRFSSDVAVVDRKLCISMQRFLQFVFLCISAIVVNAIVNPWFLLVALPVVGIYYYIQRYYRFSSRELQRIQAISRGPIFSHFHETLEGLSTIRAYREQKRFTAVMLTKIDMNNRADMFINIGNRWLSISLDYLGSVIVFLATLASTISSYLYPSVVTPSMVGLAINYTLLVPVYLNWVVKFLAEVEMFMNSVERMDRYANLDIEDYEGDLSASSLALCEKWPSKGEVEFENVSVQYGPDRPAIISGLKARIPPRQKVGICGRSGCGKSSLLMALFRISDVSAGRILIDGVDITKMPLLKLRSSLSIIPQENILFSGTLRFNLDPERKCSDNDMWSALELCQMKDTIKEMPGQLDADIKNGGASFSAGQKQLLALARAILHKSKLVIMDEATSSVDIATERTLLGVVKDVFKESTVLTIAHRLDTIKEGNRVLVLDNGNIIEDGHPVRLAKQPKSQFATMLKNADDQSRLG